VATCIAESAAGVGSGCRDGGNTHGASLNKNGLQ
jgi:hypothetical protein